MDLGIAGRTALVTAASRGLGYASAAALAAEGVNVVICARDADAVAEAEARIRAAGGTVHGLVADVTEPDVPAHLVAVTQERYGTLDILVANAGGPPPSRALDVTDEQVIAAVEANLLGSVRLVRHAVPLMRAGGWGRICCISSYSVKQPIPTLALSNLARTGLWAWVKTAAADLMADGITCNLACPGPHATERMRDLGMSGPAGSPADFGATVAFLCSASAAFISGVALNVDGAAVRGLL